MNSRNQRLAALLEAATQSIAQVPQGQHEFQLSPQLWAMLCQRYKIDPNDDYPEIGSGSFGDVFDIGDGTVLKLTEDETEAKTSMKLLHAHGVDHLVKIFDVVRLKFFPALHERSTLDMARARPLLWAIREEKLDAADPKYVIMASIWQKWRNYSSNERYITQQTVKQFENDYKKGNLTQTMQMVRGADQIKRKDISDFCKWLDDVAQETARVGIKFWDLHGGNVMRRENSHMIDDHVVIDMGHSKIEGEQPGAEDELFGTAALMEAAAESMEECTDSDAYLIDQVLPSISDDQFAAVVGLHGFVLMNALAVDVENQIVEGVLQHQERQLNVQMVLRGSYVSASDGEWSLSIDLMDESSDEPLVEHQPFAFDPETDAVNLMKALARLLGELSGDASPGSSDEKSGQPAPSPSSPSAPAPESSEAPQPPPNSGPAEPAPPPSEGPATPEPDEQQQ